MSGDANDLVAAREPGDRGRRRHRAALARIPGLHPAPAGEVLMTANGWLQILVFSVVILAVTKPVGIYVLRVYDGTMRWLSPVERVIYRWSGIDPEDDQHWTRYAAALLLFSAVSMLVT